MNYFKHLRIKLKNHLKFYKLIKDNKGMIPSSVYFKYPADHVFKGKVLNVGCGKCVYPSYNVTNVDAVASEGVNVVWDLSKTPLPFESNTFDFIITNHSLEHIPNWFECFKELARVVKPGGTIEAWFPPVSSDAAYTYRDHINLLGVASFAGCHSLQRPGTNLIAAEESEAFEDYKRLKMIRHEIRPISTWWTILAPDCVLSWMIEHLRNIASEEGFVFEKVEG